MESELFCCVCQKPSTGARCCILCKKVTYAISTCSTNSGLEEGYGSEVICNNCIDNEPPVKKQLTGALDILLLLLNQNVKFLRNKSQS